MASQTCHIKSSEFKFTGVLKSGIVLLLLASLNVSPSRSTESLLKRDSYIHINNIHCFSSLPTFDFLRPHQQNLLLRQPIIGRSYLAQGHGSAA